MTTEIEVRDLAISKAVEALQGKTVSLAQLAKILAPSVSQVVAPLPAKLPLPAVIRAGDREALVKLPEVFGSVVPTERRLLADTELGLLYEERGVLDVIAKLLETRKDGIRTSVLNHFDIIAEEEGLVDETTPRDKDGHYLLANSIAIPQTDGGKLTDMTYAWEVSQLPSDIGFQDLKDNLSHEDWLAVTEPVRVFDEHKAILHLKKRPELLATLAKIVRPGKPKGAFNLRKAK